jgi:hypothetical protein
MFMYKRRVGLDALPSFEVPRHEPAQMTGTENQGSAKGPTLLQRKNQP